MDLQISVFLLFILFTAGHSLSCNLCASSSCTQQTCSSGSTCFGLTYVVNTSVTKGRGCIAASDCINGFVNLGYIQLSTSCCNTDLCNSQDAPVHLNLCMKRKCMKDGFKCTASEPSNTANGKKCYYCDVSQNCTKVLSCSGTEDRCIKASDVNQTAVIKGCASKSYCDAAAAVYNATLGSFSCCDGNLCNGAQSVSQSFLFLCCSLLFYFLLH